LMSRRNWCMRLTSRKKRSAIVVVLFHDFAIDDAIFLASYVIDKRADFLGRQQHSARRRCRARATHDRRAHTPCAGCRQSPWHQARQSRAGQDQLGEGGRAGSRAAPAHRAPHQAWPHIEQCHRNRSQTPDGGQWFPMQVRASAIVSANRVERLDRPHHIDLAEPLEHARIMPFRLVAFAYRSGINRCRFSRGVDFSPRPGFDNRLRLRRSDRRSRMRDPASRLHHGSLLRGPRDPAASAQR